MGAELIERDYAHTPLTADDIRMMAGPGSVLDLLNPARQAYKEAGFDQRTPSEDEALSAMVAENNLVHRPVTLRGNYRVLGPDEDALRALVGVG